MATLNVKPGDSLKGALSQAKPGDVVLFDGEFKNIGKLSGIRGAQLLPITLRGKSTDTARILSSGVADVANLRWENCAWVICELFTIAQATMSQARAFQAFGCENMTGRDLVTGPDVRADHFHLVNTTDSLFQRLKIDGAGGAWLRPDVGPHGFYIAEGCRNIVCQDGEARNLLGAPLQANGQDGPVRRVTFQRWVLRDWQNGSAINLPGVTGCVLEDIDAESDAEDARGIKAYGGATDCVIVRYRIVVPNSPALEGVRVSAEGTPTPPRFGVAELPPPPPPPPVTDDWKQRALTAEAQVEALISERAAVAARWEAWLRQAPGERS